jgi:hypothetical protein
MASHAVRAVGDQPACVDDVEQASAPFEFAIDAVARDARLVVDYRGLSPYKAIEKSGLSDIGPPYDSHQWLG